MNYILGSGIIGIIAKHLLGNEWHVVPYYKSRFFSSNPPLDDNFLMRHERLDEILTKLMPTKIINTIFYKRSWSEMGSLITNPNESVIDRWSQKVFGTATPSHLSSYYYKKDIFSIYNNIRITEIYQSLLNNYMQMLKDNSKLGLPTKIENGYIYFGDDRKPYNKIISTIPIDALCKLCNRVCNVKSRDIHYIHLYSQEIDFEGANQVHVCDQNIDFYKVVNIAPQRYLFYFLKDILNPGIYMQAYLKNFEIIDGTMIKQALMLGDIIKTDYFNSQSIYPIGGYGEWDYCLDVGSSMLRLLNFLDNGN